MRSLKLSTAILTVLLSLAAPHLAHAQIDLSIGVSIGAPVAIAPPPLPVYVVPEPPQPEYIWTPGYWAWSYAFGGYYWVPGTWVQPPAVGVVWTPGYWGWREGAFVWNAGYWGAHVGFYGGVVYGGGYDGIGFHGGGWQGGHYVVNRSYVNVNNVVNVRNTTTITSYNGGPGGVTAQPTAMQARFAQEQHIPPTQNQLAHIQAAASNHQLSYNVNHGKPAVAATLHPGDFHQGVVAATAASRPNPATRQYNQQVRQHPENAPNGAVLPRNLAMRTQGQQPNHAMPQAQPHPEAAPHPGPMNAPRPMSGPRPETQPPHPKGGERHEDGPHEEEHP